MIELDEISVGYGGVDVLRNVSLTFRTGEITVILGANGSGKSTLLKSVIRLLPLSAGNIFADGISIDKYRPTELAKKVAYLPQNRSIPEMTVRELVLHGRFAYRKYPHTYNKKDIAAAENAINTLEIGEIADRRMSELSGGMRQRAYLAMALAGDAETILMDEPTTYLDIGGQLRLTETLRSLANGGRAIVLVLHDLHLALRIANKIAVLHDGGLADFGTPEEILEHGEVERIYQIKIYRVQTPAGIDYVCGM